jgi:hypothetical protein
MESKILSFDVGIKNLAYCLMTKKNDDIIVNDWNIINLVEDRDICCYELRTKNKCGKIARFTCKKINDKVNDKVNGEQITLCKVHSAKFIPTIDKLEKTNPFLCNHLKCKNTASVIILNNEEWSFCDKHEKDTKKIITQFKPKKLIGQNCSQQPIQELAVKLFTKLDSFKTFLDVDEILIENQPSLKNPNMKTIATLLYSYFVFRGIIDNNITHSKIQNVKFISPSNKLKVMKNVTDEKLGTAKNKREEYEITKGLGLIYCQTLINQSEKKYLEVHTKKDDLCDAYLQGFRYLFINGIPKIYEEKLKSITQDKLTVNEIKKTKLKNKKI